MGAGASVSQDEIKEMDAKQLAEFALQKNEKNSYLVGLINEKQIDGNTLMSAIEGDKVQDLIHDVEKDERKRQELAETLQGLNEIYFKRFQGTGFTGKCNVS